MRYITNSDGYLQQVSFGADISCNGQNCTEYTGAVPEGYDSLEAWYLKECECLYRWKIVSGNLTMATFVTAPKEYTKADYPVEQGEKDGWTYRIWASGDLECWYRGETESLDASTFVEHSGFYYAGFGIAFPIRFAEPPTLVVDGGSVDTLNFLRVSQVYDYWAAIWVLSLDNTDTDTVVHYNVYAKGKVAPQASAALGAAVLGVMKLGEGG